MAAYKARPASRNAWSARRFASRRSPRTADDDFLANLLVRMWELESGHSLPRNVRPDQLSEEELIGFWADDLEPAAGHHAAQAPASGLVCAMLAFDIAGFTRPDRDEETRMYIHKAFYWIAREAMQRSGVPWDRCHHEDRGDGALVIVPPDIPAHGIIYPLPERLRAVIRVYNRMSVPPARIQVRAAAHIGPVYRDDHGLIGDDINLLFRMLDAKPLHAALARSDAELALAISGYMHDSLVRRHPALAGQTQFRRMNTQVKGTKVNAWMHLPGTPPQLQRGRLPQPPAGGGGEAVAGDRGEHPAPVRDKDFQAERAQVRAHQYGVTGDRVSVFARACGPCWPAPSVPDRSYAETVRQ